MKTVLVVDDKADIVEVLSDEIRRAIEGVECIPELDFEKATQRVEALRPDAVVLDLLQDTGALAPPGQLTWQTIWSGRFCPVVIYTAFDGTLDPPVPLAHPFVKLVRKGSGTEEKVIEHLQSFLPLVNALDSLHREIDVVLQRVLRDTAGAAVIDGTDATYLVHAARRRVAAHMDDKTAVEGRSLFAWEQYLVPALGDSPLTADLLHDCSAAWDDPTSYRLTLSPSCDLVAGRNEASVLVARCHAVTTMTDRLNLSSNVDKAVRKVMSTVLTQGYWNGYLPLPEFPGRIPLLVAWMKDLEVIPYSAIGTCGNEGVGFERAASIDSPFREQVVWAFMNTAARPGMPDRNLDKWASAVVSATTEQGQESDQE